MTIARIRALAIVGALFIAAVVLVTISITKDNQTKPVGATCPKDAVRGADVRANVPDHVSLADVGQHAAAEAVLVPVLADPEAIDAAEERVAAQSIAHRDHRGMGEQRALDQLHVAPQ